MVTAADLAIQESPSGGTRSSDSRYRHAKAPRTGWLVALLPLIGVFVFVGCLFAATGRFGFNPTDEGLIVSTSYRILHGQIPHLDIVSARPLGSAILHTFDIVLPTPLVITSRAVTCLEFTIFTVLFGALALRRAPWCWGVGEAACVGAAVLVNIHSFPLMAWHTVDGLLFTAVGFALIKSGVDGGRGRRLDGAFLALGTAVLMKQSFVAAPVAGIVWVVAADWKARQLRPSRLIRCGLVAAIPGFVYLGVIAAFGGLGDAIAQLTGGTLVTGSSLGSAYHQPAVRAAVGVTLAALLASWLLRVIGERTMQRWLAGAIVVADLIVRAGLTGYVMWVSLGARLELGGIWAITILWMLAATVLWRAVIDRHIDGIACLLLLVGWMTSLSWGYAMPNLVGGSLALTLGCCIWRPSPAGASSVGRWPGRALFGLVAVAGLALVSVVFVDARMHSIYRELPSSRLTADLGAVDQEFWGIRSDPSTAQYLSQIKTCADRHPARFVAVLPDNAAIYGALGLDNPFPLDWMYQPELVGSEDRILRRADELSRSGHYLVLFETVPAQSVAGSQVPSAVAPSTAIYFGSRLGTQMLERLHGRRVACGSFVAIFQP